jgi:tripartite-type tricarboxylate transporter receptor subunit TctC
VAGELFATVAGVKMLNVPYKGGAPLMTDLLGGHVDMGVTSVVTALPHVSTGKLRALVVGSEKRSTALPDVPTGAEAGLPGFVANAWYGILAPAGMPADRVTKLQQEIARILETSEVKERLAQQGAEPIGSTPDEFDAFLKSEIAKWAKVVQDAGIRPE